MNESAMAPEDGKIVIAEYHKHVCPRCGREFNHDNQSVILCTRQREWNCNECFLMLTFGG